MGLQTRKPQSPDLGMLEVDSAPALPMYQQLES